MLNHTCYHKLATLNNGTRVNIRFLKEPDRDALLRFFQQTPQEDLQFCKEELDKPRTVDGWLQQENSHRTITLVAQDIATKQLVAFLNLHRGANAAGKVGEIQQILVTRTLQGQGLGSRLLDEVIGLAAQEQLIWLKAEVMTDLKSVIQAFQSRDFEIKAVIEDYFVDAKGTLHDMALMLRPLQPRAQDF